MKLSGTLFKVIVKNGNLCAIIYYKITDKTKKETYHEYEIGIKMTDTIESVLRIMMYDLKKKWKGKTNMKGLK